MKSKLRLGMPVRTGNVGLSFFIMKSLLKYLAMNDCHR
jgi:hypothetical protein